MTSGRAVESHIVYHCIWLSACALVFFMKKTGPLSLVLAFQKQANIKNAYIVFVAQSRRYNCKALTAKQF